jgi:hypothetical protein
MIVKSKTLIFAETLAINPGSNIRELYMFNRQTRQFIRKLVGHESRPRLLDIDDQELYCVSCSDSELIQWDLIAGCPRKTVQVDSACNFIKVLDSSVLVLWFGRSDNEEGSGESERSGGYNCTVNVQVYRRYDFELIGESELECKSVSDPNCIVHYNQSAHDGSNSLIYIVGNGRFDALTIKHCGIQNYFCNVVRVSVLLTGFDLIDWPNRSGRLANTTDNKDTVVLTDEGLWYIAIDSDQVSKLYGYDLIGNKWYSKSIVLLGHNNKLVNSGSSFITAIMDTRLYIVTKDMTYVRKTNTDGICNSIWVIGKYDIGSGFGLNIDINIDKILVTFDNTKGLFEIRGFDLDLESGSVDNTMYGSIISGTGHVELKPDTVDDKSIIYRSTDNRSIVTISTVRRTDIVWDEFSYESGPIMSMDLIPSINTVWCSKLNSRGQVVIVQYDTRWLHRTNEYVLPNVIRPETIYGIAAHHVITLTRSHFNVYSMRSGKVRWSVELPDVYTSIRNIVVGKTEESWCMVLYTESSVFVYSNSNSETDGSDSNANDADDGYIEYTFDIISDVVYFDGTIYVLAGHHVYTIVGDTVSRVQYDDMIKNIITDGTFMYAISDGTVYRHIKTTNKVIGNHLVGASQTGVKTCRYIGKHKWLVASQKHIRAYIKNQRSWCINAENLGDLIVDRKRDIVLFSDAELVKVISLETGDCLYTVRQHSETVNGLKYDHDRGLLYAGSNMVTVTDIGSLITHNIPKETIMGLGSSPFLLIDYWTPMFSFMGTLVALFVYMVQLLSFNFDFDSLSYIGYYRLVEHIVSWIGVDPSWVGSESTWQTFKIPTTFGIDLDSTESLVLIGVGITLLLNLVYYKRAWFIVKTVRDPDSVISIVCAFILWAMPRLLGGPVLIPIIKMAFGIEYSKYESGLLVMFAVAILGASYLYIVLRTLRLGNGISDVNVDSGLFRWSEDSLTIDESHSLADGIYMDRYRVLSVFLKMVVVFVSDVVIDGLLKNCLILGFVALKLLFVWRYPPFYGDYGNRLLYKTDWVVIVGYCVSICGLLLV